MQSLDYSKSRSVTGTLIATEDGQRLIAFFKDEFDLLLGMNFALSISTIQHGTTIDAVFMRKLEYLNSQVYVSYFSYPIVPSVTNCTMSESLAGYSNFFSVKAKIYLFKCFKLLLFT